MNKLTVKELDTLFDLLNKFHDTSKDKVGKYSTADTESEMSKAIEFVQSGVSVY